MPNTTKSSLPNLKTISERNQFIEHPRILNPLSPINRMNPMKEEIFDENHKNPKNSGKIRTKKKKTKNKINPNEDGEHSTIGSSKTQVSCSKSNNSQPEVYHIFNKYDNKTVENDELFKITPHFVNEKPVSKIKNIQLNLNINITGKNIKSKKERPLTPKLNIITKFNSSQNCQSNKAKLLNKNIDFKTLIYECLRNQNNKNKIKNKENESIEIKNGEINNNNNNNNIKTTKNVNKIDYNLKKQSYSCKKSTILKKCKKPQINYNNQDNLYNTSIKKYPINHPYNNKNDSNKINPVQRNNNIDQGIKKQKQLNRINKSQRQISALKTRKNICIKPASKQKRNNINHSRQKKREEIDYEILQAYKSESKIRNVHTKVNNEINSLFLGMTDKMAKDPEINNKIKCLIKDIKDIQQIVNNKEQTNFRTKKSGKK